MYEYVWEVVDVVRFIFEADAHIREIIFIKAGRWMIRQNHAFVEGFFVGYVGVNLISSGFRAYCKQHLKENTSIVYIIIKLIISRGLLNLFINHRIKQKHNNERPYLLSKNGRTYNGRVIITLLKYRLNGPVCFFFYP